MRAVLHLAAGYISEETVTKVLVAINTKSNFSIRFGVFVRFKFAKDKVELQTER